MTEMASGLGGLIARLPDGEVGPRDQWIGAQEAVLKDHPQFTAVPRALDQARRSEDREAHSRLPMPPRYGLRRGTHADLRFPPLGHAREARRSYAVFSGLKSRGLIPAEIKFQVSMPTAIAFLEHLVVTGDQAEVEPAYERSLFDEVREITGFVPSRELAIQWDVSKEMAIWEGLWPIHFDDKQNGIVERLVRHGAAVPPAVELGFHFCYGDYGHQHWKEPEDAANMVELANRIARRTERPIGWMHMPVPRSRSDDAYHRSLAQLELAPETRLYLGLVHHTDGVAGTLRRAETARKFIADFGIATECGMGRRARGTMPALLRIHREVCSLL